MEYVITALLAVLIVLAVSILTVTIRNASRGKYGAAGDGGDTELIVDNLNEVRKMLESEIDRSKRETLERIKEINEGNRQMQREADRFAAERAEKLFSYQRESAEGSEKRVTEFTERSQKAIDGIRREMNDSLREMRKENESKLVELRVATESKLEEMRREISQSLKNVRDENERQLTEMRDTVNEKMTKTLNDRINQSFELISKQLEAVSKGLGEMRSLSDGVSDLNRVLSNVKIRGNWGEVALDALLEQLMIEGQYVKQFKLSPKQREAVDFAIVMPGRGKDEKLYLPIDVKFPLEDYESLVDASDRGDKIAAEAASKALAARIKSEARSISEKYVKPPLTTDFAILYLPIEGLFAEVVRRAGLCDEIQTKYRVIVCGPTTITALLNSLQVGFKTMAIQKHSLEVWKALNTFKKEFEKFNGFIEKAQRNIEIASTTLGDASKRTDIINKKLMKIENDIPELSDGGYGSDGEDES